MSSIERRKHHRITVSVNVDVHSGSNFYSAKTRDISEGGVFVEAAEEQAVGAAVSLHLCLHGKKYDIHGEVTWVLADGEGKQIGYGVRFMELKRAARKAVTSFLKQRPPMPFAMLEVEEAPTVTEMGEEAPPVSLAPVSVEPMSLPPRSVDDWEPVPSSALISEAEMRAVESMRVQVKAPAVPPPLPWTPSCRPPARESRPPRYVPPGSDL